MGLLIIRLLAIINTEKLDSLNYHIANVLLDHYELVSERSIGEMATLANVSKSTMSKFARQLGFDDYYDLKDNAGFIENRYGNELNYFTNIHQKLEKNKVRDYIEAIQKDISALTDQLPEAAIARFAHYLHTYKKVGTFGLLFSESAAIDFQYKLAYRGKFIRTFHSELRQQEYIRDADEETLLIVFTNSGNFLRKEQLRIGTPAKQLFSQSKGKVIAISADPTVQNLAYVEDAIIFPHETDFQTHSFLFQIIMDLIVAHYGQLVSYSS